MVQQVGFAQVKLPLDPPACFVLELPGAEELVDVAPLLTDQEHFELIVGLGNTVMVHMAVDMMETVAMSSPHGVDHGWRKRLLAGEVIEAGDHRLDRGSAGPELFVAVAV